MGTVRGSGSWWDRAGWEGWAVRGDGSVPVRLPLRILMGYCLPLLPENVGDTHKQQSSIPPGADAGGGERTAAAAIPGRGGSPHAKGDGARSGT